LGSLRTRLALALFSLAYCGERALCQNAPAKDTRRAKVVVVAVDGFGNRLTNTTVDSFIDENGHDWVALFPRDRATDVPFGKYRISVQANGGYDEATLDVEINSPEVLITAALEWWGVENVKPAGWLRGKVTSYSGNPGDGWCKASGLYSRMQYESTLPSRNLTFDFGWIPAGIYNLTCVTGKKIIVLRTVQVSGGTVPLTIAVRSKEDLDTIK
jgi:hypothetical protein